MKKYLQKNLNFKTHCTFMFMVLLLLGSNSVNAQFNATWPFASGLTATVTGASSSNLTANTATYTSGTGGLFTGTVTTNTGFLNGTGISGKSSTSCSSLFNAVGSSTPITPYLEYKLAPNAGYSMTTNSFTFTVEQTTAVSGTSIAAGYSIDGGISFTGLAAPTGGGTGATMAISPIGSYFGTTAGTFTFTVPSAAVTATNSFILRIVIWRNNTSSSSSANFKISPPVITGTTPVDLSPVIITPSPSNLTNFNYVIGAGPSTSQPFVVGGANLTGNLVLTPSANYELSSDNSAFSNSAITISPSSGTVASRTLYARLRSGLTAGLYATTAPGTPEIVISSTGAASQNIACSGYVTTNYYHDGTAGTLATIGNWWTSPGGVGTNPSSPTFASDPYNTFYIYANATTTVAWPLGTLSKIIVGNGSTAANFTIDPLYSCTGGSIDVNAGATLTVSNSTSPTLGTLSPISTVEYTAAAAIPSSKTFGNLKITGTTSVAIQASGVTTVAGNLTLTNGAIYKIGNGSSGSVLSVGGNFNSSGSGGITTTSIISSATSAALTLTGSGKNIDNTANANDFSKLNLNINGSYSLANDFNYNTVASAARIFTIGASGSLDLNGKKLGLDNSGSVVITTGGTFTATGTGSTVEYSGTQTLSSLISYKNLTLSGASTKTLSGATTVSGTLSILGGSSLNTGVGYSLTVSNPFSLSESATFTLGTGLHTLNFAASNAAAWTAAKTLTITGWTGTAGTTGTAGQIFFGTSATGLTATQLGQITFNISSINYGAMLLSTGELVPSATVLPIKLISFTGKKESNAIQLSWSTASENNNLRFDVLRAGADRTFQKIGEVNGTGNSNSTHYYNLSDRKPLAGINYYKLSQVDFDGQTQEFGPIAITSDLNAASLDVYAAPDNSQIIVFVSSNETKEASLNIFDVSGRSLIKQSVSLQEGMNKFIIPANRLNKGIHLIEFSSREGRLIRKFIN